MVWPEVANNYLNIFRGAIRTERVRTAIPDESMRHTLPMTGLPRVRLDHLNRLTDDTGLFQHAKYNIPNRDHGYCTDDNARGLVVATKYYRLFRDDEARRLLGTYLSYVAHAQRQDGLFRNFMGYDRSFLDDVGSDDCFGRAIWGLGYVACYGPDPLRQFGREVLENALDNMGALNLRGRAYSILGLHYYLERFPEAADVVELLDSLAQEHLELYENQAQPEDGWPWFEPAVTYDSAVIPQSLFLASRVTGKDEYHDIGKTTLEFLIEKCHRGSHFSFVGNDGWHQQGEEPAEFDQQPIDACGYVEACKAAFQLTGERTYMEHMRRAFDWFLGANDVGAVLYDFASGGCADGLMEDGVNKNQGAESTLSCLLALLTLTELFSEQDRIVVPT
jgi:hypothetical protein